ncbi:MAG: hypothetical protein C4326_05510 [Ignavibacteria bacterium]
MKPFFERCVLSLFGASIASCDHLLTKAPEPSEAFDAPIEGLIIFSSISPHIKLTSELEFEHGTEEIKLETALLDIVLLDELTVRGGILFSPLGKFNLVHDGPRNEFTDRPLVSTRIIPTTLSEVGFGCYGAFTPYDNHRLTYEVYVVNGLNDDVILNGNGTSIPEGRPKTFDEDNNGSPALLGRLAWQSEFCLELGASVHTGVYNTFKKEGLVVDDKRRLTIVALDGEFRWNRLLLQREFARASIQIPPSLIGLFADARSKDFMLKQSMTCCAACCRCFRNPHSPPVSATSVWTSMRIFAATTCNDSRWAPTFALSPTP